MSVYEGPWRNVVSAQRDAAGRTIAYFLSCGHKEVLRRRQSRVPRQVRCRTCWVSPIERPVKKAPGLVKERPVVSPDEGAPFFDDRRRNGDGPWLVCWKCGYVVVRGTKNGRRERGLCLVCVEAEVLGDEEEVLA